MKDRDKTDLLFGQKISAVSLQSIEQSDVWDAVEGQAHCDLQLDGRDVDVGQHLSARVLHLEMSQLVIDHFEMWGDTVPTVCK